MPISIANLKNKTKQHYIHRNPGKLFLLISHPQKFGFWCGREVWDKIGRGKIT